MLVVSRTNAISNGVLWVARQEHKDRKSLAGVGEPIEDSPKAIFYLALKVIVIWKSSSKKKGHHDTTRKEGVGGCAE